MRDTYQFTIGYLGYFLIGYVTLRAVIVQDDTVGFIILTVGLLLLLNYVHILEKKHGMPKYGGYIKVILSIVFLILAFATLL